MFGCCAGVESSKSEELQLNKSGVSNKELDNVTAAPAPGEPGFRRVRRAGVSAEAVTQERIQNWVPKVIPKSEEEEKNILNVINSSLQVLFGHLSSEAHQVVVNALELATIPAGVDIIKQGDSGDFFYIVKDGDFDIYVQRPGDSEPKKVASRGAGGSFGELALLYNAPRAATVRASRESLVWKLDRETFQMLLVTDVNTRSKKHEELLSKVEMFKTLNRFERGQVSDLLHEEKVPSGTRVITQGEVGDRFYLLEEGSAKAILTKDGQSIVVKEYQPGECFGELALLHDLHEPGANLRKASVDVEALPGKTEVKLLWLQRGDFDRVLGPIKDLMRERAAAYPTFDQVAKKQ